MRLDFYNDVKTARVISPVSPSATGTISGQIIDRQDFPGLTFVLSAGAQTTTGITVVPVIKEGSATSSMTSVADADLLGTEAAANLSGTAGANGVTKIGYNGSARYVSCDLIVGAAASGVYAVSAIQTGGRKKPVS